MMAKGDTGYAAFRVPGNAVLEKSQRQPAYRREALRARAKGPLQQCGNPIFPGRRGNPHSRSAGLRMNIRSLCVPQSGVPRAWSGGGFRGSGEGCEHDCSRFAAHIETDDRTRMPASRQNRDSPMRPAQAPTTRRSASYPRYYIAATGHTRPTVIGMGKTPRTAPATLPELDQTKGRCLTASWNRAAACSGAAPDGGDTGCSARTGRRHPAGEGHRNPDLAFAGGSVRKRVNHSCRYPYVCYAHGGNGRMIQPCLQPG